MGTRHPDKILLVGPAGTGKTRRALALVIDRLSRASDGRFLFIGPTEEQVRHVTDVVLAEGAFGSLLESSFVTFPALARRLVETRSPLQPIPRETQAVVLQTLLETRCPPAFQGQAAFPGFRRELAAFLREVKEAGLSPGDFRARVDSRLPREDAVARERLLACAQIFADYRGELESLRYLDHEDVLARAARIARSDPDLFRDVDMLVVDSFSDYTPLQMDLLSLLIERAGGVLVTCPGDDRERLRSHFERADATRRRLRSLGLREEILSANHRSESDDLALVERVAFRPPTSPASPSGEAVTFLEAADRTDEVEEVSRRIRLLVDEGGRAYRDIGIIVRSNAPYRALIEEIFAEQEIPVLFRTGRPLALCPFVRSALALARSLAEDPPGEELLTLARSACFGVDADAADRLTCAYLSSHRQPRSEHWTEIVAEVDDPKLTEFWQRIETARKDFASAAGAPAMCRALQRALSSFGRWDDLFGPDAAMSKPRLVEEGAAVRAVWRLLDDMADVYARTGRSVADADAFVASLEELLAQGSAPAPAVVRDAVYVLDVHEARQWELPVVFVLGLVETEFPPTSRENLFLADSQRARLDDPAHAGRLALRKDREIEERMLFYVAVTRAREKLCLCWPRFDDEGNVNLRSFFLDDVVGAFTEKQRTRRTVTRELSRLVAGAETLATRRDLLRYTCFHLRRMFAAASPVDGDGALAWALAARLARDGGFAAVLRSALAAPEAVLAPLSQERLEKAIRTLQPRYSASALGSFAQCPYQHFAAQILKLREIDDPREKGLDPQVAGEVVHKVLERHLRDPAKQIPLLLARALRDKLGDIPLGPDAMRARRDILRMLREFDSHEEAYRRSHGLTPHEFERRFGPDCAGASPALRIQTARGEIDLAGKIDRIDRSPSGDLFIIDYKYSRELKAPRLEADGEADALQLAVYLLYAEVAMKARTIGAQLYALKSWKRAGIARSASLPQAALDSGDLTLVDDAAMADFLDGWRRWIAGAVCEILSGRINTAPRDLRRCGFPECPYSDLCRYEKWMAGPDD
ncbi:MAG: PD-(D/E)XK nuclease family protein [Planctomycetota bacterium]